MKEKERAIEIVFARITDGHGRKLTGRIIH
jgi:hypothetical protein